ncbi:AMIN-like domain-containing (lipo)protein [Streptosporangium sp. V21-05]|uniref:AMIN-like domain-containing (lipo)protein n=1 Tax=Streptosporangium sp. V21-05 TaxID=3446115 RepID=UPI003F52A7A5
MNRTLVSLALLSPFLLAVGCGSATQTATPSSAPPASPADPVTTTPSPTPPAPSTPSAVAAGLLPPTSTREVKVDRAVDTQPTVTGARFGKHKGFDRVVIDIKGDLPGYTARWVPKLVQDGSGDQVDVKGGAYLQLTITPAVAHTEAGKPTWTGGPIFQTKLGNVQNVVRTGDFEGVVSVGVVLDRKAPFRVLEQRNPYRLVVDIAH